MYAQIKHKAPTVKLKEQPKKVLYALAYAIHLAESKGKLATQYDLAKTIFLADRQHLNEWGRPITFDNYVAMRHGPVPSLAFDMLKHKGKGLKHFNAGEAPWERVEVYRGSSKVYEYSNVRIANFDEVLSESDMACIEKNLNVVQTLGFSQIRKITHEDISYITAWDDTSDKRSFPMSLGLLFETPDFEKALELAEISTFA